MKVDINVNVNLEEIKEILSSTDELQKFVATSIEDLRNWVMDIQEYGRDYGAPGKEPAEDRQPKTAEDLAPAQEATAEKATSKPAGAKKESVSMEMVRAKLAALVQSDKQAQVKELIEKYGGSKLSDIPPESYPALLQEAGEL